MNLDNKQIRLVTGKFVFLLFVCIFGINDISATAQVKSEFLPFFDNEDNPVPVGFPQGQQLDISPLPPQLNKFDQDVLNACGSIGTKVNPENFKQLMRSHPEVLQKLQAVTGGELRPGRRGKSDFIQDLTNIWFRGKGFEHVFCGEINSPTKIGGLHFYGRYLQLQNQGIAGRLSNNDSKQEVVPGVIYTMGISINDGKVRAVDTLKGYGYLSNAEELLIDATRIFKLQRNNEGACIFNIKDAETGKTFPSVFVRRNQAIITFYPDATPNGKKCIGSR